MKGTERERERAGEGGGGGGRCDWDGRRTHIHSYLTNRQKIGLKAKTSRLFR